MSGLGRGEERLDWSVDDIHRVAADGVQHQLVGGEGRHRIATGADVQTFE